MSIEASLLIINSFSVCCLHEKNEIKHNAFSLIWPYIAQESLPQVPRSLLTITLRLISLLYPRNSLEDFSKEIMHFHLITNMATFWEQESLVQDGHEIKIGQNLPCSQVCLMYAHREKYFSRNNVFFTIRPTQSPP